MKPTEMQEDLPLTN